MSSIISPKTPSIPDPVAPPAPASTSDAAIAGNAEAERLRRRRGAASTVLAGESSAGASSVATKTLLGS